jgi:hypothetical protein
MPGRTKYQMLFDENAEGERLREACLTCHRTAVLPMVDLLRDDIDSPRDRELLQRGRRALAERLQAYGDFTYPASGALSMAWQVLRSAMAEDGGTTSASTNSRC